MRTSNPKQSCPALWYPLAVVVLQLLVIEDVTFFVSTRGSRYDFPFSWRGRTTFVLLLCLGHMGNLTVVVHYVPQRLNFFRVSKSGCLAELGQACGRVSAPYI